MSCDCNEYEVVVEASRKTLRIPIVDGDGAPLDISAGSVILEGSSDDLPAVLINLPGVAYDGPGGIAQFDSVGSQVTEAQLGLLPSAVFTCRVRFTDGFGQDWSSPLKLRFIPQPF